MSMKFGISWTVMLVFVWLGASIAQSDESISQLRERAAAQLGTLPAEAPNPENPITDAKVDLGRMLYYDARLSKNHDVSCNTCHLLDRFGVDGDPTSTGHRGQKGGRNAPTSLNAALHIAQFWDGRAKDVESQAMGPPLNPIEMAMPNAQAVEFVLRSIPGYEPLFSAAFGEDAPAIGFDNMARAIAAFERRLITPAPFDAFLKGDDSRLDAQQQRGLDTFLTVGCTACHMGALLGGTVYQKIGLVHPYDDPDPGRQEVTGNASDRQIFKVPSLRNIEKTGPYFHHGKIDTLAEAIRLMGWHQIGVKLSPDQIADIAAFLSSLTGTIDPNYVARPDLPPSGPTTPKPDPS